MTSDEDGTPGNISIPNITEPVTEGDPSGTEDNEGNNEVTTGQTGERFSHLQILKLSYYEI